jgi:hypothetical protein
MLFIDSILSWLKSRAEKKERLRIQKEAEEKERSFLYRLGNDFESHVVTMFDPERFELIHRTPTNEETGGRYVKSMRLPDLGFREKSTGKRFWVECKYRARTEDLGTITWCTDNQLRNYKRTHYGTGDTVFIMIGLGGHVMAPNKVFCLNLDRINFTRLFYSTYCTNQVKVDKIESYGQLLQISEIK